MTKDYDAVIADALYRAGLISANNAVSTAMHTSIHDAPSWDDLKCTCRYESVIAFTDRGIVDFRPEALERLDTNGTSITYDEYLDIAYASAPHVRHCLEAAYYCRSDIVDIVFCGTIKRIDPPENDPPAWICFKHVTLSSTYSDGCQCRMRENHIWMHTDRFEGFQRKDRIVFRAEIVRYLRSDRTIDFGLRNPLDIKPAENN